MALRLAHETQPRATGLCGLDDRRRDLRYRASRHAIPALIRAIRIGRLRALVIQHLVVFGKGVTQISLRRSTGACASATHTGAGLEVTTK